MKFRERKKGRRKKNKEAQLMTKTKERQRKVTSQAKHKIHKCKLPMNKSKLPNFSSPLLPLVDNV
jgi:hypothetical protein